jgi:hypothetical protein
MHILRWNCRELGNSQRKRLLKDYILDQHIDIVAVLETKLESLPSRTLNFISIYISNRIFKPSEGNSGDILVGINESFYSVLDTFILNFFSYCTFKK